mmetsp:Transcript_29868/g.41615  ORF Transcript_29868/g.41615 Transcript_29868/m.41615 type:complete len:124 (+) Transcript_29868:235-606(+)
MGFQNCHASPLIIYKKIVSCRQLRPIHSGCFLNKKRPENASPSRRSSSTYIILRRPAALLAAVAIEDGARRGIEAPKLLILDSTSSCARRGTTAGAINVSAAGDRRIESIPAFSNAMATSSSP